MKDTLMYWRILQEYLDRNRIYLVYVGVPAGEPRQWDAMTDFDGESLRHRERGRGTECQHALGEWLQDGGKLRRQGKYNGVD